MTSFIGDPSLGDDAMRSDWPLVGGSRRCGLAMNVRVRPAPRVQREEFVGVGVGVAVAPDSRIRDWIDGFRWTRELGIVEILCYEKIVTTGSKRTIS